MAPSFSLLQKACSCQKHVHHMSAIQQWWLYHHTFLYIPPELWQDSAVNVVLHSNISCFWNGSMLTSYLHTTKIPRNTVEALILKIIFVCLFVFITNKEISSHIKFAEFTWRPARLRICCKQCFAKFVKFLQTQQLSKLCNFLRETGDLLCNLPKKLPILVTVYRIFKNFICFLSIKCLLLS